MNPSHLQWSIDHPTLALGVLVAASVKVKPSSTALLTQLHTTAADIAASGFEEDTRRAVRRLLKHTGHKPSGRGKPASEYLLQMAKDKAIPEINNVVDINNLMSLRTGWPISTLDLDRALGTTHALEVRVGRDDESYVFNGAGQSIRLKRLLGIGRVGGDLVGNPVRDAMTAKTRDDTARLVVIHYAPITATENNPASTLATALHEHARLLHDYSAAQGLDAAILTTQGPHLLDWSTDDA